MESKEKPSWLTVYLPEKPKAELLKIAKLLGISSQFTDKSAK